MLLVSGNYLSVTSPILRLIFRLQEAGLTTPRAMLDASSDRLGELIKPVGFWRRKTEFLKRVSQILIDEYKSDIPSTVEVLMCSVTALV